jgi:hypothetical protein
MRHKLFFPFAPGSLAIQETVKCKSIILLSNKKDAKHNMHRSSFSSLVYESVPKLVNNFFLKEAQENDIRKYVPIANCRIFRFPPSAMSTFVRLIGRLGCGVSGGIPLRPTRQ